MRSGSVYAAIDPNTPVIDNQSASQLPENIADALKKANELIQSVDVEDMEKITPLHASYLMIMYGKESHCPKNILDSVPDNVLQKWRELSGVSKEKVIMNFVLELALHKN